jgi:hypothetical protein
MPGPVRRPLLRGALLSTRLYADALETPVLRYGGIGTMAIEDALGLLIEDGRADHGQTPWLTRFRLAKNLRKQLPDDDDLCPLLDDLAATSYGYERANEASYQALQERTALARAKEWDTTVTKDGPRTTITSKVEVKASYPLIALMSDPRRWADNSLFWYESSKLDDNGDPEPPLAKLEVDPPLDKGASWDGVLRERVAGVALYTAHLDVHYEVDDEQTGVDYSLNWTPDNLTVDKGTVRVTKLKDDDEGWVRGEVVKTVDFEDSPYGGPSITDLVAPSYLGSWLRVQQDLWIAVATGQTFTAAA